METQFTPSSQTSGLLRLYLLGVPQILYQGQSLTLLLSRRAQALLYFLVVEPKLHTRDYLASLFWPDVTDTQARKNLRNILPELRTYLGVYLDINAQSIGITNRDTFWCDVYVLEQARTNVRNAFTENDAWELSTIYQGEFLDGFSVANAPFYEEWLVTRREYYRIVIIDALQYGANQLLIDGKVELGIQVTRLLIRIEPLNEAAYRLLMQFLVRDEQRGAALAQYEALKRLLVKEMGVDPTQETQSLAAKLMFEQSLNGNSPGETPKITQPSARIVDNLPGELTSFIGRQRETQELYAALCNPNYRLITVTGLGGMGKTRLALNVARLFLMREPLEAERTQVQFGDGIYFVPLAGIQTDEQVNIAVALAIADALKLTCNSQTDPTKYLLLELRDKEVLLILDNYEHLLAANDYLLELLRHSSKLKLLITSRSILDLQVESVYSLEGLAIPAQPIASASENNDLETYESVVLFRARMQHATRKTIQGKENLREIVQICRFVDGLPLAIELAAAMTRYYSCQEIWQKLSSGFAALHTTHQDVPERHRSLKASIDNSWQQLTDLQRQVLAACSVFPEAFMLRAGSYVADTTNHLFFTLSDASLLKPTDSGRFEMHPLVHQYAQEKLHENQTAELSARQRHAEYFTNLIEPDLDELLRSPIKLQLIQRELANLRLAWRFAIQHKLYPLLKNMTDGLFLHFLFQGPLSEGIRFCNLLAESLDSIVGAELSPDELQLQSTILAFYAFYLMFNGSKDELRSRVEQALPLAKQANDLHALTLLHFVGADFAFLQGDMPNFENHHRLGIEIAQKNHIQFAMIIHLAHWSLGAAMQGQASEALFRIQESLRIVEQAGYEVLYGYVQDELSLVYLILGELELANDTIQQALQKNVDANTVLSNGYLYERAAIYAENVGDYQQAINWAQRVLLYNDDLQNVEMQLDATMVLGRSLIQLGDLQGAETMFRQALATAETLAAKPQINRSHIEWGILELLRGHIQDALEHFQIAIQIAVANNISNTLVANAGLAYALLQQNEEKAALLVVDEAVAALLTQPLQSQQLSITALLYAVPVLFANDDPRGLLLLQRGYDFVILQAQRIHDQAMRRSFLENVSAHRQLLDLARKAGVVETQ